jgi:hypothetical protein
MMPFGPSATAFTWGEFGSIVTMMIALLATSSVTPPFQRRQPQFPTGLRVDVINHQFIPCLQQVLGHGFAHDPQADKSLSSSNASFYTPTLIRHLPPDRQGQIGNLSSREDQSILMFSCLMSLA